jgi:putative FmdB family regulatory protein
MPTYEYVCEKCGHEFEKFQSMAAKPLVTCPENLCGQKRWGKGKVKKKISLGAGLIFKGSGFYITDYRSDKYKEAAKKESGAATSTSAPASGETSAKPAASPENKPAPKSTTKPAKPAKSGD